MSASIADVVARLAVEGVQPRAGRGGWHGGPTPLGALRGVTAAQAAWAPAPGRKSIWALALHVAYWKYAVRRRLEDAGLGAYAARAEREERAERPRFPRSPANWPRLPAVPDEPAWRADVALLKAEHERLVATIAAVPVARYGEALPGGKRWTVGELVLGIAQHDAYHAGQIQMLKRLWDAMHPGARAGKRAGARPRAT